MKSGAGGSSPIENTSRVTPLRISIRPGRDFSPTYIPLTGTTRVLSPGGTTVV